MFTLHLNALRENSPRAINVSFKVANGDPNFTETSLSGEWYRVFPNTGRDVRFIQMLEHRIDKFAPASGGGVLIHPRTLTLNRN